MKTSNIKPSKHLGQSLSMGLLFALASIGMISLMFFESGALK